MRANVFRGVNEFGIEEVEKPRAQVGEAVVRVSHTTTFRSQSTRSAMCSCCSLAAARLRSAQRELLTKRPLRCRARRLIPPRALPCAYLHRQPTTVVTAFWVDPG
jgi:hypothetical protein